ncbi:MULTISPECIES: LysR family transcriptional regulator [Streptomyces]|uniref:LysR family transcriptional regulator n=1 Tax=Streptomyces tsukubensis (strain DSM 42081 / NBRC 108919 / NRRL 18488 / 9993) TaxID=1114943 RepID=A0A7G3U7V4_STRT9|nr:MULTISPECIES: LysR family transcriptional regulator [Streptomyces]AZK97656.1 LysR family transcriptional regulator [Streptomyces tsukubensis]MYS68825.1 LysR family transcriptional regulator [Streptomyces sp. SID5473]QKM66406.1 LysR family transcriptional regulator [Streptomyces tsukubensis NRRL18488]TAI45254.1 LysR family transcriptional regulator [Streptomyces tsukubensis]
MIDVQRLRVLRQVAECGSFNRAAAALGLTPSAVSQHIAALERTVGTPVVTRSTRGAALTEAGRIMVAAAESVAAELAHARRQVDLLGSGRPRLTVATFTSGGRFLLPGALAALTAACPDAMLHVREAEPEDALRQVRQGAVQLALAYCFDGPLPGGRAGVEWIPLLDDPLRIVLPAGHRLADRTALDLGELASEPWVLGCLRTEEYLRRYAARAGFAPQVRGTTTDYFFACSLVAAGLGVGLVPSIALAQEMPPGVCAVPVAEPEPVRRIGIAVIGRRRDDPLLAALTGALRDRAAAVGR